MNLEGFFILLVVNSQPGKNLMSLLAELVTNGEVGIFLVQTMHTDAGTGRWTHCRQCSQAFR